jgi:hypothetical protein
MEKAGSETGLPSALTLITMLVELPTFALVGFPESAPVAVLKVAHAGRLTIEKLRAAPLGSDTTGVKP